MLFEGVKLNLVFAIIIIPETKHYSFSQENNEQE